MSICRKAENFSIFFCLLVLQRQIVHPFLLTRANRMTKNTLNLMVQLVNRETCNTTRETKMTTLTTGASIYFLSWSKGNVTNLFTKER